MSREARKWFRRVNCVPRASGDEPNYASALIDLLKCSPRERG